MATMKITSARLILTIFLVLFKVISGIHLYVHHSCSDTEQFTTDDPFQINLEKLVNLVSTRVPQEGFISRAFGKAPSTVYGQALCRGDVNKPKMCKRCIKKASDSIRTFCPHNKKAIIWYEKCLLRYSNTSFNGEIDNENKFMLITVEEISEIKSFKEVRNNLLYQLADESWENEKRFAMGQLKLNQSSQLYGLTQCTLDLSALDCKKCLDYPVTHIKLTSAKVGVYFVSGSCTLRYETYSFSLMFKF